MMQYTILPEKQGICPPGWHLPSDNEWKILEGLVDSMYDIGDAEWDGIEWRGYDAGQNLKSTIMWDSDGNGTDSYGFTAFPGGGMGPGGAFAFLGTDAYFWTSTMYSGDLAWGRGLHFSEDRVYRGWDYKDTGFSVRCLKDTE